MDRLGVASWVCLYVCIWIPLWMVSSALIFAGYRDLALQTSKKCEAPLGIWALVLGATLVVLSLVHAISFFMSRCVTGRGSSPPPIPGSKDAKDGGGGGGSSNTSSGSSPSVTISRSFACTPYRCGLSEDPPPSPGATSSVSSIAVATLYNLLVIFVPAWLVVGACWVFPLERYGDNHSSIPSCDPFLSNLAFYLILISLIGLSAALACLCLLACALAPFILSVEALSQKAIKYWLTWVGAGVKSFRGGGGAGGGGGGRGSPLEKKVDDAAAAAESGRKSTSSSTGDNGQEVAEDKGGPGNTSLSTSSASASSNFGGGGGGGGGGGAHPRKSGKYSSWTTATSFSKRPISLSQGGAPRADAAQETTATAGGQGDDVSVAVRTSSASSFIPHSPDDIAATTTDGLSTALHISDVPTTPQEDPDATEGDSLLVSNSSS